MNEISVIVPVYNTDLYLAKCVDSILNQSLQPLEIILVDDGSTDNSASLCDQYAEKYPDMVKVIHQPNKWSASARNAGLEVASGRFVSFIDSDDRILPDFFKHLSALQESYQADMVCCEMLLENEDGSTYCRGPAETIELCFNNKQALLELFSYQYMYFSFCNALLKRELFDKHRFPLIRHCEDSALLYQVITDCKKIVYTSKPLYLYYQRKQSNSRNKFIALEPMEISLQQLQYFKVHHPELVWLAETNCFFYHLGIITAYVRNDVICPKTLEKKLLKVCRHYLPDVVKNKKLLPIKKIQAVVFCVFPGLYKAIIRRTEHR